MSLKQNKNKNFAKFLNAGNDYNFLNHQGQTKHVDNLAFQTSAL